MAESRTGSRDDDRYAKDLNQGLVAARYKGFPAAGAERECVCDGSDRAI